LAAFVFERVNGAEQSSSAFVGEGEADRSAVAGVWLAAEEAESLGADGEFGDGVFGQQQSSRNGHDRRLGVRLRGRDDEEEDVLPVGELPVAEYLLAAVEEGPQRGAEVGCTPDQLGAVALWLRFFRQMLTYPLQAGRFQLVRRAMIARNTRLVTRAKSRAVGRRQTKGLSRQRRRVET
jgi:hypothetical protein